MTTKTKIPSLVERLEDPNCTSIDPHEVAREIKRLYDIHDERGIRNLKTAYILGLKNQKEHREDEAVSIVNDNLLFAARLADMVASCGYEASGQLHAAHNERMSGPITQFYRISTSA